MINTLLLLSGCDIPFPEAKVNIHVPKIRDIAVIGEQTFFIGCGFLNFSKDLLDTKDKTVLEQYTDFDILMTILMDKNNVEQSQESVEAISLVLALLFPDYEISFDKRGIVLLKEEKENIIDNTNFNKFKEIVNQIFNLTEMNMSTLSNIAQGPMAQRIAEKLKKRHQQLAKEKGSKEQDIFGRYISILAVGENKDMNALFNYTVFQLYDEIKRFNLKREFDSYFKAKLAGAQNLGEVGDWEIDIYDPENEKNNKK